MRMMCEQGGSDSVGHHHHHHHHHHRRHHHMHGGHHHWVLQGHQLGAIGRHRGREVEVAGVMFHGGHGPKHHGNKLHGGHKLHRRGKHDGHHMMHRKIMKKNKGGHCFGCCHHIHHGQGPNTQPAGGDDEATTSSQGHAGGDAAAATRLASLVETQLTIVPPHPQT